MLKNFKPVSLILCAGALCFSGSMYANIAPVEQGTSISQQNGKVTGTVEDDFGPVTGASVVVKGTSNGTITDMDGNFTLDGVKNGDVIQISFIGYSTMELTYTDGHPDYHQPSDHADRINWDKVVNITKASFLNMWYMANEKDF